MWYEALSRVLPFSRGGVFTSAAIRARRNVSPWRPRERCITGRRTLGESCETNCAHEWTTRSDTYGGIEVGGAISLARLFSWAARSDTKTHKSELPNRVGRCSSY